VYLDENNLKMCYTFRLIFSELISALLREGKNDKALIALDRCIEVIPGNTVPRRGESVVYADAYYQLGQPEKAQKVIGEILYRTQGALNWYASMKQNDMINASADIRSYIDAELQVLDVYQEYDKAKYKELQDKLITYAEFYLRNGVGFSNRSHPLDYLMRISMRGFYLAGEDSVLEKEEHATAERIGGLMQKYTPELLRRYTQPN
jgi:tetratricopeptide (TPR) repeat protein